MSEPRTSLKAVQTHCANCGAELHGPYCHACGQPVKHLLKHVPALAADAADLVFNIDGRIMHTLPALYLRPGFLTNEYFAGRRARYIPPFRLMFFLSVLFFLVVQLSINLGNSNLKVHVDDNAFAAATTETQVQTQLQKQLKGMQAARSKATGNAGAGVAGAGLDIAEEALRREARQRIAELHKAAKPAHATSSATPGGATTATLKHAISEADTLAQVQSALNDGVHKINARLAPKDLPDTSIRQLQASRKELFVAAGQRMQALGDDGDIFGRSRSRVHVSWLPAALNARLQAGVMRMRQNISAMRSDRDARMRFLANAFNVLPVTMLVLMPFFALLLKIAYLFKRRLYVEHLIVAFHSHAFMFLSLLLLSLLQLLKTWVTLWASGLAAPINLLTAAGWIWIPVYLLLMQKRVYQQGWIMTWVKYLSVGICYLVMLAMALFVVGVITLMD